MSQAIFPDINPSTTSGNQLATLLNGFKDAVASGFSGTTRPANLQASGYWIDVSQAASPNYLWKYMMWTGSNDVLVFTLNIQTNTVSFGGASGDFEITQISADAIGPVIRFLKERIANNGQVLAGDDMGGIEFYGAASDDSNPLAARVRAVATENMTGAASGTMLIFEATTTGSTGLVEVMRVLDGKLGVGTDAPENTIHAKGSGIRSENESDTDVGAVFVSKKKRIADDGQVLNGDVIHSHSHLSTDDNGDDIEAALEEVIAVEDHTSTEAGSRYSVSTTDIGEDTPTEKMRLESLFAQFFRNLKAPGIYMSHTTDSASTGADQTLSSPDTFATSFTGSLTSILDIGTPTETATVGLFIHINKTGGDLTYRNNANIRTGTGSDLRVKNGASVFLVYDIQASIWTIVGGSGAGGGASTDDVYEIDHTDSPYDVPATAKIVVVDATGGNVVVVLPPADTFDEVKDISIKRIDSNESGTVEIQTEDQVNEDIDGEDSYELLPKESVNVKQYAVEKWGRF